MEIKTSRLMLVIQMEIKKKNTSHIMQDNDKQTMVKKTHKLLKCFFFIYFI